MHVYGALSERQRKLKERFYGEATSNLKQNGSF